MQSIMSNDELQNLEKAGRFRKQVDKNKEKVMDMLKMNGPEYLPIQAGKAGLVIDEPSLKRRKLEIEDLAEKAQIIKQARETQYELSMGRALLERKQSEFFEKQATPFQIKDPKDPNFGKSVGELIRDTAEQNKKQLDAINANLEKFGLTEDKISALQGSLAEIVNAIDANDDEKTATELIGEVSEKLSKIPAFKDDGEKIKNALMIGMMTFIGSREGKVPEPEEIEAMMKAPSLSRGESSSGAVDPTETATPPLLKRGSSAPKPPTEPKPEKIRPKMPEAKAGEAEAKAEAEPELEWDSIPKFQMAFGNWLNTVDGRIKKAKKFEPLVADFLQKFAKIEGRPQPSESVIKQYAERAARYRETTGGPVRKAGKGLKMGKGWNESYQQYMASGKTIDDIARLRNNLRKDITGKGLLQDVEMFGKKLKKNFTGKGGITTEIHKDFLKKNYKIGKGVNYSKMTPQQLMKNLTLNIASMQAGNTGVKDQINSIIDQMLDRGIIKKAEHKKLWYQYVD